MALTCYGESSQDATLPNTFSSAILQRRITMKHFEFKQAKQGRGSVEGMRRNAEYCPASNSLADEMHVSVVTQHRLSN